MCLLRLPEKEKRYQSGPTYWKTNFGLWCFPKLEKNWTRQLTMNNYFDWKEWVNPLIPIQFFVIWFWHGFCSGWAITLAFTGVADLSEVMEHVSWTTSHTTLYLLYQLVKVFNPGGATPSVRINSRGTLTGCRSLRLSKQWAGVPSMADILIEKNLRLLGHVHRVDNNRLPKNLLYFQLCLAMYA